MRKRFDARPALDGAELTLWPGEVHAVLGENGAGKTTLMGVLAGMLRADEGELTVRGRAVEFGSPRDALEAGVGMVHQHFKLVPRLSVLENLSLGVRFAAGGLRLPYDSVRERVSRLQESTGLEVPLDALVEDLPVGLQQRVEILKLLIRDPDILVLDEPTAVLAPQEVDRLLGLLRGFAAEGKTVVLIAHKLDEVLAVADRITVLRHGRTVLETPRSEVDTPALVRAMVGKEIVPSRRTSEPSPGDAVARLSGVSVDGPRGEPAVRNVSLEVRRGEIVGIAGVDGNGQRELATLFAARLSPASGTAELPRGIGFIPEDRGKEALVAGFSLTENVALSAIDGDEFRSGPWVRWDALADRTGDLIERFDVRATGPAAEARELSGGNQQKLVIARELERATDLLIAQNPARGLDVSAEEFVHRELLRLRDEEHPPGIVLISIDLDEVLALSDRVYVMVRGELVDMGSERNPEAIGSAMLAGRGDA